MKKTLVFSLALFLNTFCLNAQSWQWLKTAGSISYDKPRQCVIDKHDNIYIGGLFLGAGQYHFGSSIYNTTFQTFTMSKYDKNGNEIWFKYFNFSTGAGFTGLRYDSLNDQILFLGTFKGSIQMDSIYLTGSSGFYKEIFIGKMDLNGQIIWAKSFGSLFDDGCFAMDVSNTGDIYLAPMLTVAGTIDSTPIPAGGSIIKLDQNGNVQWVKGVVNASSFPSIYGTSMEIRCLKFYKNKIFISGGQANYTIIIDTITINTPSEAGIVQACFDQNANVQWARTQGKPTSGGGYKIETDEKGNLYTLGWYTSIAYYGTDSLYSTSGGNSYILKTDSIGNYLWVRELKSAAINNYPNQGFSYSMSVNRNGQTYITGLFRGLLTIGNYSASNAAQQDTDMFVARIDSDGTWKGLRTISRATGETVVTLSDGTPVVSGTFYGNNTVDGNNISSYGDKDIFVGRLDVFTNVENPTERHSNSLLIYANPNNGTFRFDVPKEFEHESKLTLIISDMTGKESDRMIVDMENLQEINLSHYASGNYIVRLSNGRRVYVGQMVVE